MDIQKIINSALGLEKNLLKEYFELHQKESGLKPELFFGLLKVEIKKRRKKLNIDFSRIDEEDYQYSINAIVESYQGNDYNGFIRLASGLYILEEFINKKLYLLLETNENYNGPIWTPGKGLITKDLPSYVEADELDCNDSDSDNSDIVENLLINEMPIEDVKNHFKKLVEKRNKDSKHWMTPEDFDIFIRRSFGLKLDLTKPKINIGSAGKYAVVELFYLFYEKCLNYRPYNKKELFVNLLKDAFMTTRFNDLLIDNFKKNKNKYEW